MPSHWTPHRPGALVVACSDGRLQQCVDGFLETELGITDYDRLYLPGGPGALATSGEFLRADFARRELEFLIDAHRLERIVLLFHGAAPGGPEGAVCADYRRKLFGRPPEELAARQEQDAARLIRQIDRLGKVGCARFAPRSRAIAPCASTSFIHPRSRGVSNEALRVPAVRPGAHWRPFARPVGPSGSAS